MQGKRLFNVKMLCAIALISTVMVQASNAYIGINWLSVNMTDLLGVKLDNTLIQLIWSIDSIMDPAGSPLAGSVDPVGDDLLLDWNWTGSGNLNSEGVSNPLSAGLGGVHGANYENTDLPGNGDGLTVSDAAFRSGSLYVRVFDATDPGVGDWYYQGGLVTGFENDPAPSSYSYVRISNSQVDTEVVPEPGTMALFGIGLVTLAVRRRKRK